MRLFIINLLVASLLAFSVGSAAALEITLDNSAGSSGSQVSVTVAIDTQATSGIVLLSVGVLFNDAELTYNKPASSATSYALYGGRGGGGFLAASSTCGGYPTDGTGCSLRVGLTNQVNIDYVSADLTNGTANTGSFMAATLVFDIVAGTPAPGTPYVIDLTVDAPGNTVTLSTGPGTATLVVVPEPGIAGLSLAALLTLTTLRVRGRRKSENP
jgi:hypothetical protein